jgi:RNA-directed DNA polymerase
MVTNDGKKFKSRSKPNEDTFKRKLAELNKDLRRLPFSKTDEILLDRINKINSKVRGILNYYQDGTYVYIFLRKYGDNFKYSAFKALKRKFKGRKKSEDKKFNWIRASQTHNLVNTHKDYPRDNIPAFKYNDHWIGITSLTFVKYVFTPNKNQEETPYSTKGRNLYVKRTNKKPVGIRADELLTAEMSDDIKSKIYNNPKTIYNFEYFLNRPYAYNRDKGKCRICGEQLIAGIRTHHIDPALPLGKINRVVNLASMHDDCHRLMHSNKSVEHLGKKISKNIMNFRGKLGLVE